MSSEHHIEVKNVSKVFPIGGREFSALKDVSLTIAEKEFIGLIGPSGSGKTTLLNLLGGLDKPTSGEIIIDGERTDNLNANALADLRNRRIGFIFQAYNLLPVYTARENVEFPLLLQGGKLTAQINGEVEKILTIVGLADKMDKRPATLSGGECQRVAIARAMVKNPDIILADEPTANLDSENSHAILKIMKQLNQEFGTTFVFATHDEKVMNYLNRTIHLTDGRITKDEKHP
jgi:putative ABC transport system ATP-binding protein